MCHIVTLTKYLVLTQFCPTYYPLKSNMFGFDFYNNSSKSTNIFIEGLWKVQQVWHMPGEDNEI